MAEEKSLTISRRLFLPKASPSIDYKYGLYNSIDEAYEYLGEDGLDCICEGLTFGIKEEDGSIVEYWFNGGVEKENIEPKSIIAMSDEDIDKVIEEVFGASIENKIAERS